MHRVWVYEAGSCRAYVFVWEDIRIIGLMQIHVQRGEEELGTFTPEETTQQLGEGKLLETDLAWCEGHEDKIPVAELLEVLQTETGNTFDEERTVAPDLAGEVSTKEGEVHPVFGGGRYTRDKLLGRGGMGQVWLAFDKQLERQVAVKMVSKKYVANQKALNALKAEVQKSLELTHPNIVRIHDLTEIAGEDPFISMEYIEGEELSERREKQPEGRFTWREIEPYILKLCEALDHAHGQGMGHIHYRGKLRQEAGRCQTMNRIRELWLDWMLTRGNWG